MKKHLPGISSWLIIGVAALLACAPVLEKHLSVDTTAVRSLPSLNAPDVRHRPALRDGKIYTVELRWKAENIHIYSEDSLRTLADSLGIARLFLPYLRLWAADPIERPSQRFIQYQILEPPDYYSNQDRYNGNRIRHWILSDRLTDGGTVEVVRRFQYRAYTLEHDLNMESSGVYPNDAFYRYYTREEPGLEQTAALQDSAKKIVQALDHPLAKTRAIANWLRDRAEYFYPPAERGAAAMLNTLRGDCGQYSMLFVALCRASGIPARIVSGFRIAEDRSLHYHIWAESFLPDFGWVPADVSLDSFQLGRLDHRHLIASVGINIPLVDTPEWATLENSELDGNRAPFMQLATVAKAGFKADISTELVVVRADDF